MRQTEKAIQIKEYISGNKLAGANRHAHKQHIDNPAVDRKYTQKEILDLATMPNIPYQIVGNSWLSVDLILP